MIIFFSISYTFIEKTLLVNASNCVHVQHFFFASRKYQYPVTIPVALWKSLEHYIGLIPQQQQYYLNWKKIKIVKTKTCRLLRSQARMSFTSKKKACMSSVLPVSRGLEWASGHVQLGESSLNFLLQLSTTHRIFNLHTETLVYLSKKKTLDMSTELNH